MKKILALCAAVLIVGFAAFLWTRSRPEHHGQPFQGLPPLSVAELLESGGKHLDRDVRVEGLVVEQ